jgi:hypothetical protein
MIVLIQGESLQIPATVTGTKASITALSCVIKKSVRGEIPTESATTVATLLVQDFTSAEITDGYLFYLTNTSALTPGTYYVNYQYTISGKTYKGDPMKVLVKEGVI